MNYVLYETNPIDMRWEKLPLADKNDPILKTLLAAASGWEGDFSEEPRISYLPNPDNFEFLPLYVWKQGNNGTTFVGSPMKLPWVEDYPEPTQVQVPDLPYE